VALTLVRHTRPLLAGLCAGLSEVELAPSFAAEAAAVAGGIGSAARIVSSPLGRCRRLADDLGHRLGLPVALDDRWREMDFGSWEGRAWDALPRGELDAWAADLMHARPHGGESVAMLLERTRGAIEDWGGGEATLAVTHAGVIRAALFAAGDAAAWQREIPFGGIFRMPG
jgi:alpha-ribazole phosphatase